MRNSLIFLFIAFSFIAFAQKKNQLPPGTIKVEENLFFDKTEISNSAWNEYRTWLKV